MASTECIDTECSLPSYSMDLCRKHYQRNWRQRKGIGRDPAKFHRLSEVDRSAKVATCSICGPLTPIRVFSHNGAAGCLSPAGKRRRKDNLSAMGMTPENYDALRESQGNACGLCRGPLGEKPHLDHDHSCCPKNRACSKCLRGLLCNRCNTGLGKFRDDPALLLRAVEYLQRR